MTKRVLLITYHFPPSTAVGGLRSAGLCKYLPEFGWQPTVLTVKHPDRQIGPGSPVVETDFVDILSVWKRRLGFQVRGSTNPTSAVTEPVPAPSTLRKVAAALGREFLAFPDAQNGWIKPGKVALGSLVEQYDAVFTTSPPASVHMIGRHAKERLGIPWVADYRDLWTTYHYYPHSAVRRLVEQRYERQVLRNADFITTVSEPFADRLKELHGRSSVAAIPNGFDVDTIAPSDTEVDAKFTLTHTGYLYEGKRDPSPLFAALQALIQSGHIDPGDIEINFYGRREAWLDQSVKKHNLEGVVFQRGSTSHDRALTIQRASQVLLLLNWNHPDERQVYPAKVFEYLAAGRPVLGVGAAGGVLGALLDETQAGTIVDAPDHNRLVNVLMDWYALYKKDGRLAYSGLPHKIMSYSQREMAHRLAGVLDGLH